MIDLQQAEVLALRYLTSKGETINTALQLSKRVDLPYGWLYFYNSSAYLQHGELGAMLAGNAPFIIDASDGALHEFGTAHPIEEYLKEYEANRGNCG